MYSGNRIRSPRVASGRLPSHAVVSDSLGSRWSGTHRLLSRLTSGSLTVALVAASRKPPRDSTTVAFVDIAAGGS